MKGKVGYIFYKLKESVLFKQSAIYLITEGINKAIPFVLLPIISYYLTPTDYGVLTNFNVITQIFAVFCYSITTVIIPVMFFKLVRAELQKLISNIIVLNTIVAFVILIIVVTNNIHIENATSISLKFQIIAIITTVFASFTQVNLTLWRCEEKPWKFGLYHISQTTIDACSTLILVIVFLLGWTGRVYSMACASIGFGLFSLFLLAKRGYLNVLISPKYIGVILSFCLPLLPHGLSFWIKSGADKLLLSNMCGLEQNGLYSVAMTFGAIISIFVTSFNNAFVPHLFKKLKSITPDCEMNIKISIVRQYRLLVLILFVFVIISYLASVAFIKLVYQESYSGSLNYLPFIMLGQLFMGFYSLFVNFLHYSQNTKVLGSITFGLTFIQIIVSYLLMLRIGSIGCALYSAITSFVIFVSVSIYSNKVYPMPWRELFKFKKNDRQ